LWLVQLDPAVEVALGQSETEVAKTGLLLEHCEHYIWTVRWRR